MQVASPPLGLGPLTFPALILLLRPLVSASPALWALAGATFFVTWWSVLVPSVLRWGISVLLLFIGGAATSGAMIFGGSALLNRNCQRLSPVTLPAAWIVVTQVYESCGLGSFGFAASLVSRNPLLAPVVRAIGGLGVEATVLFVAAFVARRHRRRTIAVLTGACAALLLVLQLCPTRANPVETNALIVGLQTATQTESSAATSLSLTSRRQLERRLDQLTSDALAAHVGALVVWPEGGNRLPNAQLPRRRERMQTLLADGGEVLLAGHSLDLEGNMYSSMQLFVDGSFVSEARKASPVPIAESYLSAGEPTVLVGRQGRMGIQICFDSLRWAHAQALRRLGADFLIVSSDDESFGRTALVYWHEAISVLHAVEAGLPLAFISNAGPTRGFDADGRELRLSYGRPGESRVVLIELPLERKAAWGWRMPLMATAAAILLVALCLRVGVPSMVRDSSVWRVLCITPFSIGLALMGGVGTALGVQLASGDDLRLVVADWRRRAIPHLLLDEISEAYQQSSPAHCGAAAIAYVLTMLGDEVLERDVVGFLGRAPPAGYSFSEIADYAQRRGFAAVGYEGNWAQLRRERASMLIAHVRDDHFVVIVQLRPSDALLFDPATGKRFVLARQEFERIWSGRYMRVVPMPIL